MSHASRARSRGLLLLLGGALAACADAPTAPSPTAAAPVARSEGRGVLHRYVAIGTSVSMGWQSDGVYAATQETSWPAQLARMGHRELSQPYIQDPGCRSPLMAPLALNRRRSGEAATAPAPTLACAPLVAGVRLPTGNVAINAARTRDALATTPETVADLSNRQLYGRVLPAGHTQVSAMTAQNPKLVSVELGGNEVLDARLGHVVTSGPGANVVPVAEWVPLYRQVVDAAHRTAKHAVLVGLVDDVASFPSFRRAGEVWDNRATFAQLYVSVSDDCNLPANRDNLIFVPTRVADAAARGRAAFDATPRQPPHVFSCVNHPDHLPIADYVLGPASVAVLNQQLAEMNAVIGAEAARRGFAHFALDALYGNVVKGPFDAYAIMTTPQPYGPLVSLDGVHPTAAGSTLLAEAAAAALNARYGFGIPILGPLAAVSAAR